jgi:hypothetical protein
MKTLILLGIITFYIIRQIQVFDYTNYLPDYSTIIFSIVLTSVLYLGAKLELHKTFAEFFKHISISKKNSNVVRLRKINIDSCSYKPGIKGNGSGDDLISFKSIMKQYKYVKNNYTK